MYVHGIYSQTALNVNYSRLGFIYLCRHTRTFSEVFLIMIISFMSSWTMKHTNEKIRTGICERRLWDFEIMSLIQQGNIRKRVGREGEETHTHIWRQSTENDKKEIKERVRLKETNKQ